MNNKLIKKRVILLILFSILVFGIFSGLHLAKDNPKSVFIVKEKNIVEDYSIINTGEKLTGTLCNIYVLYTGEVTEEIINEYAKNVVVPEGTIVVNIKFYNCYEDNKESQNYSNLKYEIKRVL